MNNNSLKNKSQLVYVIKVFQRDKNTKEEEIKMYPIYDTIFDSKEELEEYLLNRLKKKNKELIKYDIRLSYAVEYRKKLEIEKQAIELADLVTIDRKIVRKLIKDLKKQHGGWKLGVIEKDITYALFNLLGINTKDIFDN